MKRVFLVVGECGEYSDWRTWDVAAYPTKDAAEQHAALANAYMNHEEWEDREKAKESNPYDSKCETSSTVTKYSVEEVSLFLHVDQYQEAQPAK